MLRTLTLHPDSRCDAVARIEVDTARPRANSLRLRYLVTGRINDLLMPAATVSKRADQLWQHTCFEAFIRPPPGTAYAEFNFAPSTEWAAYRFSGYRQGMTVVNEIGPPRLNIESAHERFTLDVSLMLNGFQGLAHDSIWRLGLSAVIEEANGRRSYWALAHPPGKADFHHADCFALELPRA